MAIVRVGDGVVPGSRGSAVAPRMVVRIRSKRGSRVMPGGLIWHTEGATTAVGLGALAAAATASSPAASPTSDVAAPGRAGASPGRVPARRQQLLSVVTTTGVEVYAVPSPSDASTVALLTTIAYTIRRWWHLPSRAFLLLGTGRGGELRAFSLAHNPPLKLARLTLPSSADAREVSLASLYHTVHVCLLRLSPSPPPDAGAGLAASLGNTLSGRKRAYRHLGDAAPRRAVDVFAFPVRPGLDQLQAPCVAHCDLTDGGSGTAVGSEDELSRWRVMSTDNLLLVHALDTNPDRRGTYTFDVSVRATQRALLTDCVCVCVCVLTRARPFRCETGPQASGGAYRAGSGSRPSCRRCCRRALPATGSPKAPSRRCTTPAPCGWRPTPWWRRPSEAPRPARTSSAWTWRGRAWSCRSRRCASSSFCAAVAPCGRRGDARAPQLRRRAETARPAPARSGRRVGRPLWRRVPCPLRKVAPRRASWPCSRSFATSLRGASPLPR